ncbi:MAG: TolC family protein [Archangium sp.]|nr:TolC family protein [Archangium sp.]
MSPALAVLAVLAAGDAPVKDVPLSLGEVVQATRELYPSLLAAQADVEAAGGERLSAAGAFDPVWRTRVTGVPVSVYPQVRVDSVIEAPTPLWGATFFGGYRIGRGKFQAYYGERETWSAGELRAGAVVPVLRNGPIDRRRATEARAVLAQSIAGLAREQQELELLRLASFRYWEWVAAGMRRDVARSLLVIAKERDAQLATRARVGDVAQFDRQDNTRALVQREALLVQAQRGLDAAAFELSLFLRDPKGEPVMPAEARLVPLPDPPPAPGFDLDAALGRRPEVKRLIDQQKAAEVELRFQQNQLLPALDLGVVVSGDLGTPNTSSLSPLGPAELEFNAVLDVPLLYRAPLGRIQAARAALGRLGLQLRLARDRAAMEVNDSSSALLAARERVVLARREVEVALQLENGERKRFELGDSSLLFVNLREQTTVEAKLREIDALLDAHRAEAALRAALALGLK